MKKITLLFICTITLISACRDKDDFFTMSDKNVVKKFFMRGDGEWNINEAKFWIINPSNGAILDEVTCPNAGYFRFNSATKMDIQFVGDTLDAKYLRLVSQLSYTWSYLAGSFDWPDAKALGQVVTIDKKNMILFFPSSLNIFTTTDISLWQNVELQFKLSKK